ncbi:hypothetical protein AALA22_09040 [Anaerovoracaceae bacterium 41-7]
MKKVTITWHNKAGRKIERYIELHISGRVQSFLHKEMPKGAIYGYDKDGPFMCYNYAYHGDRNGFPMLKVWRPDYEHTKDNWVRWKCVAEASLTTQEILTYYQAKEKLCMIEWGDMVHELAKRQDLRADIFGGEVSFTGKFTPRQPAAEQGRTVLTFVVNPNRTLDDIAKKQKGQYYLY